MRAMYFLFRVVGRNGRALVPMVSLLAVLGVAAAAQWLGPIGARAQDDSGAIGDGSEQLDVGAPVALPAPPQPCSGDPPADGPCPLCTTDIPGASDYEKGLPVPSPLPGFNYVVQLVNESNVTVLAASNAAHRGSSTAGGQVPPPFTVVPREGTWVMQPKGSPNNGNILTIDIPAEWEGTQCPQDNKDCDANGPRFFVRTGCNYDIAHNLAQCETGTCGDAYDCGKQALRDPPLASAGRPPVTIVEWTFNAQGAQGYNFPDISLVDGVSLTADVQAIGDHCASKPGVPGEPNWLSQNQPLAVHGADLREASRCIPSFRLTRGEVGQIIKGEGNPNDVVACFTNCGRYEYPRVPGFGCDPTTDQRCKNWLAFCCYAPAGDPDHIYGGTCSRDDQCRQNGACWNKGSGTPTCGCRAFIKNETCPDNVCTHPNPPNLSAQPTFGHCSDVTGNPDECIGDDTVHAVFPGGYTWPNDPQTYVSDARAYRIIFAPGGTTVPITESGPVPVCGSLPDDYQYAAQVKNCKADIDAGAVFAAAALSPACDTQADCPIIPGSVPATPYGCNQIEHLCTTWSCKIGEGIPIPPGTTLCRWAAPPPPPPTPTATGRVVCLRAGDPEGSCVDTTPTPTPRPPLGGVPTTTAGSQNDDGCAVVPTRGGSKGGMLLSLLAAGVLLYTRRRSR